MIADERIQEAQIRCGLSRSSCVVVIKFSSELEGKLLTNPCQFPHAPRSVERGGPTLASPSCAMWTLRGAHNLAWELRAWSLDLDYSYTSSSGGRPGPMTGLTPVQKCQDRLRHSGTKRGLALRRHSECRYPSVDSRDRRDWEASRHRRRHLHAVKQEHAHPGRQLEGVTITWTSPSCAENSSIRDFRTSHSIPDSCSSSS